MTRWLRLVMAVTLALASPAVPTVGAADSTASPQGRDTAREGLVTGPLDLGPGQVARLRVYGLAPRFGRVDLRLLIKDPAGQPLASKDAPLEPGQSVTLELPRTSASPAVPVHGEVELLAAPPPGPCPKLRATLEIYDAATGRVLRQVEAGPACPVFSSEPVDPIIPQ